MATLRDVALRAGVSPAAVSYVINNKGKVSAEVSEKIRSSISELGYIPKKIKNPLQHTENTCIRLYCADLETIQTHLFFNGLLSGILSVTLVAGYDMAITPLLDSSSATKSNTVEFHVPVCGSIIINPRENDDFLEDMVSKNTPFVVVGRPKSKQAGIYYVDSDNIAIAYNMTKNLIEAGHREIVLLNGPRDYTISVDRADGYRLALRDYAIPFNENLIYNAEFTQNSAVKSVDQFLESGNSATAIIANSDAQALGALTSLTKHGKRIPKDYSLICCGETLITTSGLLPISGADLNFVELGVKAAELLIDVVEKRVIKSTHYHIPFVYHDRESVLPR